MACQLSVRQSEGGEQSVTVLIPGVIRDALRTRCPSSLIKFASPRFLKVNSKSTPVGPLKDQKKKWIFFSKLEAGVFLSRRKFIRENPVLEKELKILNVLLFS